MPSRPSGEERIFAMRSAVSCTTSLVSGRFATARTRSLASFCAAGLAAFPALPLGGSAEDLEEVLVLKVLPAVLAAAATAWHVGALRAQVGGVGSAGGVGVDGRLMRMSPESESASMPMPRASLPDE